MDGMREQERSSVIRFEVKGKVIVCGFGSLICELFLFNFVDYYYYYGLRKIFLRDCIICIYETVLKEKLMGCF